MKVSPVRELLNIQSILESRLQKFCSSLESAFSYLLQESNNNRFLSGASRVAIRAHLLRRELTFQLFHQNLHNPKTLDICLYYKTTIG